jgi:hypothetical protein
MCNERRRTTRLVLAAVLVVVGSPLPAMASVVATAVNQANGHTYHLLASATWTASEVEAVTLGGHLVTINDPAENAWVEATFKSFGDKFWIGYSQETSGGPWLWIDGDPSTYVNWGGIEPNNGCPFDPEDVAIMFTNGAGLPGANPIQDGEWADIPGNASCGGASPVFGVVEVSAQPVPALKSGGLLLLVIATLSLGTCIVRRGAR